MRIGLVQYNPAWEDKTANQSKILGLLAKQSHNTDLLVFPELTLTGFTMRSQKYAELLHGPTIAFFKNLANDNKTDVIFGMIEQEDKHYYNTLVHLSSSSDLKAVYRKIHPFSFSGENRFYQNGSLPVITEIDGHKIGLSICYDLRFPELFRIYAKENIAAIINIANWPVQRIGHWQALIRARAIENLCYFYAVNRVGKDKGNTYTGRSMIVDPTGSDVVCAGAREMIYVADLNWHFVSEVRVKFPFLKDIKLL